MQSGFSAATPFGAPASRGFANAATNTGTQNAFGGSGFGQSGGGGSNPFAQQGNMSNPFGQPTGQASNAFGQQAAASSTPFGRPGQSGFAAAAAGAPSAGGAFAQPPSSHGMGAFGRGQAAATSSPFGGGQGGFGMAQQQSAPARGAFGQAAPAAAANPFGGGPGSSPFGQQQQQASSHAAASVPLSPVMPTTSVPGGFATVGFAGSNVVSVGRGGDVAVFRLAAQGGSLSASQVGGGSLQAPIPSARLAADGSANAWIGTASGDIGYVQLEQLGTPQAVSPVGKTNAMVLAVTPVPGAGPTVVATSAGDNACALWDARSPGGEPSSRIPLPQRAFSLDSSPTSLSLLAATADRHLVLFDLRRPSEPLMARLSPLRYQTRVARFDPTGSYFVLGGVDGRAAVVSASPPTHKPASSDFKFAVARTKEQALFVNDVSFHPTADAFCLAGGDGVVSAFTRSKMQLFRLPAAGGTSASCVSFAPDGSAVAVGYSYDYCYGAARYSDQASIFVRAVTPNELKANK